MLALYIVRNDPLEESRAEYSYKWSAMENYHVIDRGTVTHNRVDGWRALVRRIVEQTEETK